MVLEDLPFLCEDTRNTRAPFQQPVRASRDGELPACAPCVLPEVYGTSESGVNDERSDKKGRRCRIVVVVT